MSQAPEASRHLPLGLQYIFTSLACRSFALALAGHSCGAGGAIVDIHTSDPRHLEPEDGGETYIHTALLMPDGQILDAEGSREFAGLCEDFGMRPELSRWVAADWAQECHKQPETPIICAILDACGWQHGAPDSKIGATASRAWKQAKDDFERRGGMCAKPLAMLREYLAECVAGSHMGICQV